MSAMEEALQSASKFYSKKWVVDEVPNTVIENNGVVLPIHCGSTDRFNKSTGIF